ncbi:MAG: isoprenylcysteine carboxylmethyltransferase family protein [Betaproteobacteria bacterium]
MQALELKLPPPLIASLAGLGMWLTSQQTPELTLLWRWHLEIACLLALSGGLFDISGALAFYKFRTTINPLKPANTSAMVTCGVYRYSRNPMYCGLLLMLCGWAIYLSHPLAFLGLPAFVAYLNRFQIIPEERVLSEKFGAEYAAYCNSVRRWL